MSTDLTTEVDPATLVDGAGAASAVTPSDEALPQPGEMLGRYRIESELGRGGMGVVFAALDPKLERRVAIKLVIDRARMRDAERITREAQAVARLSHPNVVQVFDVGVAAGLPYVVMEMIEGATLSSWLEASPRRRDMLRVLIEAGQGLEAAHAVGLVHRDFKPANVLVGRRGSAKVLDFGLARPDGDSVPALSDGAVVFSGNATLTETGIAVGTPAYMAPEQHRGERVGTRADVYAFGVTLYEALVGRRPFSGRDAVGLYGLKHDGAPEIDAAVPLSSELRAVIERTLAFDPDDRPASIGEVIAELRRARKTRTRRGVWVLGAVVVGVAATAAGWVLTRPEPAPEAAPAEAPASTVVNLADEEEALRLTKRARELDFEGRESEALGWAYASLLVARSSGSARAHGSALRAMGRTAGSMPGGHELGQGYLEESAAVFERAELGGSVVSTLVLASLRASQFGRDEDAKTILRRAYAAAERYELLGDTGEHMELLMRSAALQEANSSNGAKFLEDAVAIFQRNPSAGTRSMRAAAELHLGLAVLRSDLPRARKLFESSERRALEFSEPSHPAVTSPRLLLAEVYRQEDDAVACLGAADRLAESLPPDDINAMRAALLQSACNYKLRRYEQAERISSDVVQRVRTQPKSVAQQELLQNALQGKGITLTALDRFEQADAVYQELLVLAQSNPTPLPVTVAAAQYHLGNVAVLRGQQRRAEDYYRQGLEVLDGRKHTMTASIRVRLGILLVRKGRPKAAVPMLGKEGLPDGMQPSPDEKVLAKGYRARMNWEIDPTQRDDALRKAREALDAFAEREHAGFGSEREELEAWIAAHSN